MPQLNADMNECIQNCEACHHVCMQTLTHCLNMGGTYVESDHIRTLMDCVQICHVSSDFMMRGSPFHNLTCAACAEVCEACAKSCDQYSSKDTQMQACATVCRRCAESCRQMAGQVAA